MRNFLWVKPVVLSFLLLITLYNNAQQAVPVDFDAVDSLINTTPEIDLCKVGGKDDVRFFSKTPEKYSDFKQVFMTEATGAFTFSSASHFFCDITVEVSCKGKAGNYNFSIEPRTFKQEDFEYFKQLIALVNRLRNYDFKPAYYLGENVNSKVRFRLMSKEGKVVLQ